MNFLSFFGFSVSATFTPGPNNIMSMTTAGKFGFKRALRYCIGVMLGFFVLLMLGAIFSSVLGRYIENISFIMKIIGALYMLYLAFIIVRDKPHEKKDTGRKELRPDSILTGFILQFINPKGIMFSITIMSAYVLPYYTDWPTVALFAGILALMALASTSLWGLGGAVFERVFREHKKVFNAILGLLLVYCAVSLFL
ncbi:LysE family transporter [Christensenellaceae bacterium OttesenSCG-928-M15]|nr:LysE family transporter [Christensenellaceae bacterium OttesenSCG-928-M15]